MRSQRDGSSFLDPVEGPNYADGAVAPSERIVVGGIGLGGRGRYVLSEFLRFPVVQFVAIADCQLSRRQEVKKMVDDHYGMDACVMYRDLFDVLGRDDVDAVLIATGDRWHTLASIAAVSQAVASGDATSKEYATQALGGWLDTSAAPLLIALARSEGSATYGVRGMRGYIRLARQFSVPAEDRAEMCRTALRTAERLAEKKLVLEVLERYPSVDTLRIAVIRSRGRDRCQRQ